ncbi:MAG TPA: hypothetical protein VF714_02850, partial [Jatrophihabitans sp.]
MAVEKLLTAKLTPRDTTERDGGVLLLSARLLPGLVDEARPSSRAATSATDRALPSQHGHR